MVTCIVLLIIGFIALIKGADWFVNGSSDIAKNLRIPSVIIGLTIVAFGTSAPELAVSVAAAIQGANEISVSNVIGSNIFNLMVVLGVCASIKSLRVDEKILRRDMPISIVLTMLTLGLCVNYSLFQKNQFLTISVTDESGMIHRWLGIALIIGFIGYLYLLICDARKNPIEEDDTEILPIWKCVILVVVGLVLIIGGGQAVVNGAREIARMAGMTETLIGLTIVAVGTSLPELVTSIVASKKGETDLAIGNVICTPFSGHPEKGVIFMRFSYDFKKECVEAHRNGVYLDTPEGISTACFRSHVRRWRRLEDLHGPEALKHKQCHSIWTAEQKLELVTKVMAGESVNSVAESVCITAQLLSNWVRRYKTEGYNGLVKDNRGRPPKGNKMKKETNPAPLTESEHEELVRLRAEIEYIKAENEVIKKEIALREEKEAAQLKAKKQQSSRNSEKKDTN